MIRAMFLLLLCSAAFADPHPLPVQIPSAVNGVYIAPERTCRVEFYRFGDAVRLDLRCLHHGDGRQSWALHDQYAPDRCPTDSATWAIDPAMPLGVREHIAIRGYDLIGGTLSVVIGIDQTAVANGNGIAQTWHQVESIGSPGPYTCESAQPYRIDPHALARFCRSNPTVPACKP